MLKVGIGDIVAIPGKIVSKDDNTGLIGVQIEQADGTILVIYPRFMTCQCKTHSKERAAL
jgi:hypothetical protein